MNQLFIQIWVNSYNFYCIYFYVRHNVSKYYDFIVHTETRDKEIAKLYIDVKKTSELHFQTHIFDIFEGLKIINSNFIYNNILSALYNFPTIFYAIRKLQSPFDKSTLGVEYKNAKEFLD